MKRWLLIQSDGAHKGQDGWTPNWYLRECWGVKYALEQLGQAVEVWGLRHDNFSTPPDFDSFDYIFVIEQYELDWLPNITNTKPKKLMWVIDACLPNSTVNYVNIFNKTKPTFMLHSISDFIPWYATGMPEAHHLWFPNAIDDRYFFNRGLTRDLDVLYVGTSGPTRKQYVEGLQKDVQMQTMFITGEDMINTISSAKIHWNKSLSTDINYRVFETIALGTCLVSNYVSDLDPLGFVDGVNCLTYTSYKECLYKIRTSLKTGSWKEIGEKGYLLSKDHTYTKRIEKLLDYIKIEGL